MSPDPEAGADRFKKVKRPWSRSQRILLTATIVVLGPVVIVAALVFSAWLPDYLRSAEAEPKVAAAQAQFKAPPGWTLVSEWKRHAAGLCIDTRCPEYQQVWDVGPTRVTRAELESTLSASGYVPAEGPPGNDCRWREAPFEGRMVVGLDTCWMRPTGDPTTAIFVSVDPNSGSWSSTDPPPRFVTLSISRKYG